MNGPLTSYQESLKVNSGDYVRGDRIRLRPSGFLPSRLTTSGRSSNDRFLQSVNSYHNERDTKKRINTLLSCLVEDSVTRMQSKQQDAPESKFVSQVLDQLSTMQVETMRGSVIAHLNRSKYEKSSVGTRSHRSGMARTPNATTPRALEASVN